MAEPAAIVPSYRRRGFRLTARRRTWRGAYDLNVAMYHDQGHIPTKLVDFKGTVNISMGIRKL
jgi:hypothetical protein